MKKQFFTNRLRKAVSIITSAALISLMGAQTALASTSYVSTISIRLNIDLAAGGSLPSLDYGYTDAAGCEVTISSNSKYDIESAEWIKDESDVELGDTYNLKVTLSALGDYEFKSSYTSSKVNVKGGTFVSAKRNSDDELVVTLKSKPAKGTLEEPDDVEWVTYNSRNNKFGYATWDKVTNAKYDVTLYRNEKLVHRVTDLSSTTYNFYPYMTKEGDYTFRVRAVPKNDTVDEYADKSGWVFSDELYVDDDEVSDGSGQGVENTTGNTSSNDAVGWILSNGKWYFRYPDGSYLRDSWGKINNIWYLFDSNGQMLIGWHNRNNKYYYMNSDGGMKTGWLLDGGKWYYLKDDGAMATGWVIDGDKTYYMESNGAMITGWKEIDGEFYYFHPDGHKAVNEVINGFYVDYNGIWHRP